MIHDFLFGLVMAAILGSVGVDEARLTAERAADADVLASLHRNSDCASVVRAIDLHFLGSRSEIAELSENSDELGFAVIQTVQVPSGEIAIDLSVQSDALASSIDRLTVIALKIEKRFGVRYDGWGTVAKKC